jgi:hypothetical protein
MDRGLDLFAGRFRRIREKFTRHLERQFNAAAGIGQITVRNLRLTIAEFPRRGLDGNSI